ncbi:carbamoyltransferase C-terminal domain-containing protein [Micromonospora sp. LZ34]
MTRAPRWAPPCTSPATSVTGPPRWPAPTSVGAGRTTSWRRSCGAPRCRTPGRTRSPPRRPGCSPATASSPGSRDAASTARAPWHRSLLAHPGDPATTARLNDVKGREQFRPVAPMVRAERAAEIFEGVLPSPYMLFVHRVKPEWRERIPAVTHVDGTARVQTVHADTEPLVADLLAGFERLTGLPVVVNTSLNTAGRPMVDTPREAMELFGSAPVELLALGPFAVRRNALGGDR